MDYLVVLASCAVAGFCAKFSDEIAERRIPMKEAVAAALLWGAISGLLSSATPLSSLFFAMAVASILAAKFDHELHLAALGIFAAIIFILPVAYFSPWLFSIFLVAALLDEIELPVGGLKLFTDQRLLLPAAALVAGVWTGEWIFALAVIVFDLGYRGADAAAHRFFGRAILVAPTASMKKRAAKKRK